MSSPAVGPPQPVAQMNKPPAGSRQLRKWIGPLALGLILVLIPAPSGPVSYTHLDVIASWEETDSSELPQCGHWSASGQISSALVPLRTEFLAEARVLALMNVACS